MTPLLVLLAIVIAGAAVLAGPAAAAPVRAAGGPEYSVVARGLAIPWDIAFLPDGRALVTERGGDVRIIGADGVLAPDPAASPAVNATGEGGLLGVAIDPAFSAAAPFVYLSLTVGGELQVQRWRLAGSTLTFEAVVLQDIPSGATHGSGRVRFGPDGGMYLGTGDAGTRANSQNPGSLSGKILRVPPGAFRGGTVTPTRIASGLRHPQGLAWQPGSNLLWATDHGPSGFDGASGDDELNLIQAGADYGWPARRGADQRPFASPSHLWATTIAPTSIMFVTQGGSTWTGRAIVTALRGQQLRLLTFNGTRVTADEPLVVNTYGRLRAIAEAPDGSIWFGTSNRDALGSPRTGDDQIIRIVPPAAPAGAPAPVPTTPRPRVCPRPARGGPVVTGPLARRTAKAQRVAQLALRRMRILDARVAGRPAPRLCPTPRARSLRATARQVVITQRIALSALRLHATVSRRVTGRRPALPPALRLGRGPSNRPATAAQVIALQRPTETALKRANTLTRRVGTR